MFLNFINEFKASLENRKWNYPNRKWNYFSYFLASDQKASLKKYLHFKESNPRSPKLVLDTGNENI